MISKEMYSILKCIPRHPQKIGYLLLKDKSILNENFFWNLMCEAQYQNCEYINILSVPMEQGDISLTERGQAAIEEYEQAERNQKVMDKSLNVARIAMWAAIASAVAAIASLVKMFI